MMTLNQLTGMLQRPPMGLTKAPRFADIAFTATAKDFAGIYRGKQYHEPDVLAVLDRAHAVGVQKIMLTGMSLNDIDFNLNITQSRPQQCIMTVGVHPYHASEPENSLEYMKQLFSRVHELLAMKPCPIAAFGELGLDYDHLERASKDAQMRTFKTQLDMYIEHDINLPLFLHCRSAFEDFVQTITPYLSRIPRRGIVHSFVGSTAQMHKIVELGLDVSVNGYSFRDQDSLTMVRDIPLTSLHLETDSPWGEISTTLDVAKTYLVNAPLLPPSKKRDKFQMGCAVKGRNESFTMERVAMIVAGLKGISVDEVMDSAWENSSKLFGFSE